MPPSCALLDGFADCIAVTTQREHEMSASACTHSMPGRPCFRCVQCHTPGRASGS